MAFVYRRPKTKFWWMCWTDANGVEQLLLERISFLRPCS